MCVQKCTYACIYSLNIGPRLFFFIFKVHNKLLFVMVFFKGTSSLPSGTFLKPLELCLTLMKEFFTYMSLMVAVTVLFVIINRRYQYRSSTTRTDV